MNYIKHFIDIFMHMDKHMTSMVVQYGAMIYLILFTIIFCETGLVVLPFLPGDSIIFATGALASSGSINLLLIFFLLSLAAIAGDTLNYHIGHMLRVKIGKNNKIKFIKTEYLERTQVFFNRNGVKTIIIARFIPIIRTFAPFVAGVGKMPYKKFILYNIIGGVAWVTTFLFGGYFFGSLAIVKRNFSLVILGIIFVSLLPSVTTYLKSKYDYKKQ